ncbi:F-box protein pof6-like [Teratosphaeria destructans]|uniref:F-box protein pof6-like n=1 Tax=Teratosphaeria destructans TaxID=418781 RepID=A0A9W7SZL1_9PEZI|nr:F-box protein pof6-like [Teratosphaeria destructans]
MLDVFYAQELVAAHLTDRDDFLDPAVKAKKHFEQMLDERVAAGLNKGIDVLMHEVEHITASTQPPTDFNPGPGPVDNLGPSPTARQVVALIHSHTSMLLGSTDKPMLDVFTQEVGLRLFTLLCKHFKRQRISVDGAVQLIADINHYSAFVASLRQKPLLPYFHALRELGQIYLAKALAALVADGARYGGVFAAEEVYEFAQRRADWFLVRGEVERAMYGVGRRAARPRHRAGPSHRRSCAVPAQRDLELDHALAHLHGVRAEAAVRQADLGVAGRGLGDADLEVGGVFDGVGGGGDDGAAGGVVEVVGAEELDAVFGGVVGGGGLLLVEEGEVAVVEEVGVEFVEVGGVADGVVGDGRVGAGEEDLAGGEELGDGVVEAGDRGAGVGGGEAVAGFGGGVVEEGLGDGVVGHEAAGAAFVGAVEEEDVAVWEEEGVGHGLGSVGEAVVGVPGGVGVVGLDAVAVVEGFGVRGVGGAAAADEDGGVVGGRGEGEEDDGGGGGEAAWADGDVGEVFDAVVGEVVVDRHAAAGQGEDAGAAGGVGEEVDCGGSVREDLVAAGGGR